MRVQSAREEYVIPCPTTATPSGKKLCLEPEFAATQGVNEPVLSPGKMVMSDGAIHLEAGSGYSSGAGARLQSWPATATTSRRSTSGSQQLGTTTRPPTRSSQLAQGREREHQYWPRGDRRRQADEQLTSEGHRGGVLSHASTRATPCVAVALEWSVMIAEC